MTDDEFRSTDYLATCKLSYGVGSGEDSAVIHALRYAGPFEDDEEPVEVAVWELYADSWRTHSMTGPERTADMISFTRYEIPPELAGEASALASDAFGMLSTALHKAEVTEEIDGPHGDDDDDDE